QQHFGIGIVPTANDFGAQGELPTHPELLDWLAVELVESGWNLKHVHRLMVTSATYRQSSCGAGVSPALTESGEAERQQHNQGQAGRPHHNSDRDPQNRLLWHARRRRLEGEAIRDSLLSVSGELNRRMLGVSARPVLPEGSSKSYAWAADERPEDRDRRSVYVLAKRNLRYPLFEAFDQPDMHHSCPRRAETTTAPQSLVLLNGELALEQAQRWAERLLSQYQSDTRALVAAAYRQAFCRPATEDELKEAITFIEAQAASKAGAAAADNGRAIAAAVTDFCHALMNANEFLYVD
ncbi:MAG: DUF1553 domain-containing protein, partial [Pirellulales bacterium]